MPHYSNSKIVLVIQQENILRIYSELLQIFSAYNIKS